jgi:hypothetical protein
MKKALLFLVSAASLFGAQAITIDRATPKWASGTVPNSSPFTSYSSFTVVARIHNCTVDGQFFWNTDIQLETKSSCTQIWFTSWRDSADGFGTPMANIPVGATDITVRATRNNATKTLSLEVWQTNTGDYRYSPQVVAPIDWCATGCTGGNITDLPGSFGVGNGASFTMAGFVDYVRFFSTVQAGVGTGAYPVNTPGGDFGDWELEGNGTDGSGHSQTLTLIGSPGFVTTPTYSPIVAFLPASNCFISASYTPKFCTVRTGATAALNTTAYTPNQGDTITYLWAQTGGPLTAPITGGTTAAASATGLNSFGDYSFQVTVTDSELNATASTLEVGAVSVDASNCIITSTPADQAYIVGPLTPWGSDCDLWPWYDQAEIGDALSIKKLFGTIPASITTPGAGTITISVDGSQTASAVGTGTNFTTACAGGSCANWMVLVWWNAPLGSSPVLPAGATGRNIQRILTVTDNTHIHMDGGSYKYIPPAGSSANVKYSLVGDFDTIVGNIATAFGWRAQPPYSWNYYDTVTALYRIYYRTGVTQFRDFARQLADVWYTYAFDQGYDSVVTPRNILLSGIMIRALDGQPDYWTGIETEMAASIAVWGWGTSVPSPQGNFDPRETGFLLSFAGQDAKLNPTTTNRATYCTLLNNGIQFRLGPSQLANGNIADNEFVQNSGFPAYAQIGGSEPWILGTTDNGIKEAYRAMIDPAVCNNPTRAAQALSIMGKLLTYQYQYGVTGTRSIPPANGGGRGAGGFAYKVDYEASGEDDHNDSPAGTVTRATSTTLTGSGTSFTSAYPAGFGPCDGSTMIAISAIGQVLRVTACPDNTHLTLGDTMVGTATAANYQTVIRDGTTGAGCNPSLATWCFGAGNTDLPVLLPGIFGWYYQQTGIRIYKLWAEDMFAASYGGPAGGPGTTGSPVGPGSSGQTVGSGGYTSPLPACSVSSPPCGGANGNHYSKDFGDGSGSGAGSNFLAFRLMGPTLCGN